MPSLKRLDNQVQPLAIGQSVTTSWVDLGNVQNSPWINVADCLAIVLWLKVTIGGGLGNKVRIVAKASEAATDEYLFPFEDPSANPVTIAHEEKLLSDATQNILLPYGISDNFPLVKFQILGGTAGSTVDAGISFTSNLVAGA